MLTYDDMPDPGLSHSKTFIQTVSITEFLSRQHAAPSST